MVANLINLESDMSYYNSKHEIFWFFKALSLGINNLPNLVENPIFTMFFKHIHSKIHSNNLQMTVIIYSFYLKMYKNLHFIFNIDIVWHSVWTFSKFTIFWSLRYFTAHVLITMFSLCKRQCTCSEVSSIRVSFYCTL